MTKVVCIDEKIHKKLKIISSLSENSMKAIATKIFNETLNDLLSIEMTKYLESEGD